MNEGEVSAAVAKFAIRRTTYAQVVVRLFAVAAGDDCALVAVSMNLLVAMMLDVGGCWSLCAKRTVPKLRATVKVLIVAAVVVEKMQKYGDDDDD